MVYGGHVLPRLYSPRFSPPTEKIQWNTRFSSAGVDGKLSVFIPNKPSGLHSGFSGWIYFHTFFPCLDMNTEQWRFKMFSFPSLDCLVGLLSSILPKQLVVRLQFFIFIHSLSQASLSAAICDECQGSILQTMGVSYNDHPWPATFGTYIVYHYEEGLFEPPLPFRQFLPVWPFSSDLFHQQGISTPRIIGNSNSFFFCLILYKFQRWLRTKILVDQPFLKYLDPMNMRISK